MFTFRLRPLPVVWPPHPLNIPPPPPPHFSLQSHSCGWGRKRGDVSKSGGGRKKTLMLSVWTGWGDDISSGNTSDCHWTTSSAPGGHGDGWWGCGVKSFQPKIIWLRNMKKRKSACNVDVLALMTQTSCRGQCRLAGRKRLFDLI